MTMNKNVDLRATFNEEAELYDLVRPHYPEELFDSVVKTTQLQDDAKLLEIGPGTGQATEPFAKRGYEIIAVELGVSLANLARKKFKNYHNVKIITGAFEDIELPLSSFDLVYSATAINWVKPEFKFSKPYKLLKSNGYLAIIHTNHVSDEKNDDFFFAIQPIYKKYKPGGKYDDNLRFKHISELKADEIDENFFTPVLFQVFPLIIRYSANEYAQLLNTYSPQISMKPDQRANFIKEIKELINEKFGGSIQKHFAMTLTLAKKK